MDLPSPKTNQTNKTSNSNQTSLLQCLREVLEAGQPHSNKDRPVIIAVRGEEVGVEEQIRINSERCSRKRNNKTRLDRRPHNNHNNLARAFLRIKTDNSMDSPNNNNL